MCMELVKFRMEKNIDFCTIVWVCLVLGIESIDTWFGTLYHVYGLGLETPKLISC